MNGLVIGKAQQSGIIVKDHKERNEIILEQERLHGSTSQVWIKSYAVEELVKILQSLI